MFGGRGPQKGLKLCRLSGALDRRGRLGQTRRMALAPARAAATPRGHRVRRSWRRLPPGDGPGACPRLGVVGDPLKPPAQLDGGRQLALLIEDSADRIGVGLGDNEHPNSMGARATAGKAIMARPSPPGFLYVGEEMGLPWRRGGPFPLTRTYRFTRTCHHCRVLGPGYAFRQPRRLRRPAEPDFKLGNSPFDYLKALPLRQGPPGFAA